ncbi:DDE-type integrase/transposase/recombinase [Pseudomonas cerasi]|uniref:DDE-type integrase/transposase/recombinase n=1 Tax=Pseudomonas cerasi TaxID=1583341 RepID=UPI0009F41A33
MPILPERRRHGCAEYTGTRRYRHSANEKWVIDVTEFNVGGKKLYLSPVLDLFNGEVVAVQTARRPLFDMVGKVLGRALERIEPGETPILHYDPGWQ